MLINSHPRDRFCLTVRGMSITSSEYTHTRCTIPVVLTSSSQLSMHGGHEVQMNEHMYFQLLIALVRSPLSLGRMYYQGFSGILHLFRMHWT